MARTSLSKTEKDRIEAAVAHFDDKRSIFEHFADTVHNLLSKHDLLLPYIHFIKYRIKSNESLRRKLTTKALEAKADGQGPDITPENLFERITDLAGVRLIHLYIREFEHINAAILHILDEEKLPVVEGPIAHIWDKEYESYFKSLEADCVFDERMYTSVHYIVKSNTRTEPRCELQVRTLTEELWGEVSHKINYPEATGSIACAEQLCVLARITSSCTRLVDAIFTSHEEFTKCHVTGAVVKPATPGRKRKKRRPQVPAKDFR